MSAIFPTAQRRSAVEPLGLELQIFMFLEIKLGQSEIMLKILKNRKTIDLQEAKYYHDLSDVLISALDKLLKRNKLDLKSLKSYKIQGDLGSDSTSYKIAVAFVEALKFRDRS